VAAYTNDSFPDDAEEQVLDPLLEFHYLPLIHFSLLHHNF